MPSCLLARFPRMTKLADCKSDAFKVEFKVVTEPPYHLVIALPVNRTNQVSFRGEILLREEHQATTIQVNSEDMFPCAWLKGEDAYILTWSQTNRTKLDSSIVRGKINVLEFKFSEAPPRGSSIWLRSTARTYTPLL